MKTYRIYGIAHVSKHLGEIQANSKEEAEEKAWDVFSENMCMSVCHQCTSQIGGDSPEISEIKAEEE